MDKTYIDWIESLKQKIKSAQLKASIAVNEEMIRLYWDIGKSIVEKQESFAWGSKVVEQLAKDLKRDLPDTNGFSRTNLFAMRKFYSFFKESELIHQAGGQVRIGDFSESSSIVQQDVGQIENTGSNLNNPIVQQAVGQLTPNSVLCKIPWGHHIVILNKTQSIKEAQFYTTFNKLSKTTGAEVYWRCS